MMHLLISFYNFLVLCQYFFLDAINAKSKSESGKTFLCLHFVVINLKLSYWCRDRALEQLYS